MKRLDWGQFDIYALALPCGHAFGDDLPVELWQTEDQKGCAIVRQHERTGALGILVMRRRDDGVWTITCDEQFLPNVRCARARAKSELKEGGPLEKVPPGTQRRAALYDLKGRTPGSVFRLLTTETYHNAAWLLNQLYLSLPRPDRNWAADCQTENFNARLWEAQLLASFREQGLRVTQPVESPDFRLENKAGEVA